jgi:hypothetical protein
MCAKARPTGDDLPGRAISIHALLAEDGVSPNVQPDFDARQILQAADVILGMDVMTRGTFIVYGRDFLANVSDARKDAQIAALIKVELDQDSDELAKLLSLVDNVKGRHEFQKPSD